MWLKLLLNWNVSMVIWWLILIRLLSGVSNGMVNVVWLELDVMKKLNIVWKSNINQVVIVLFRLLMVLVMLLRMVFNMLVLFVLLLLISSKIFLVKFISRVGVIIICVFLVKDEVMVLIVMLLRWKIMLMMLIIRFMVKNWLVIFGINQVLMIMF